MSEREREGHATTGAEARSGPTSKDGTAPRTFTEEFRISGEKVLETLKTLVREGNVRRIILKNEEGRTLIEIPLTLGVIGTALLPVWAAVGAIAALVANLTIAVEKVADEKVAGGEVADGDVADGEARGPATSPPPTH